LSIPLIGAVSRAPVDSAVCGATRCHGALTAEAIDRGGRHDHRDRYRRVGEYTMPYGRVWADHQLQGNSTTSFINTAGMTMKKMLSVRPTERTNLFCGPKNGRSRSYDLEPTSTYELISTVAINPPATGYLPTRRIVR
jgi:hypothetical protein